MDILKEQWSPALNLGKILLSVRSLLGEPNPNAPGRHPPAAVFISDRAQYNATAREYTKKYATEDQEISIGDSHKKKKCLIS